MPEQSAVRVTTDAIRVVVVGGEPGDLAVLGSVAAAPEFDLRVVAADAPSTIAGHDPDCVVIDAKQRGTSGHELCTRLRADPALAGVPLILVSSLDGPEAHRRAYAAGCDEYVEKPLSRSVFGHRLRSLARLRRAGLASAGSSARVVAALTAMARVRSPARVPARGRMLEACQQFGVHVGLSSVDRLALERAATLHDLGESAVPDAVIVGPPPTSHHDRAILHRHTEVAAAVLEPLSDTARLVEILRYHHERWDGSGYPDSLDGERIPRLARIFRIVDTHDALVRTGGSDELPARLREVTVRCGLDPTLASAYRVWLTLAAAVT
jgi:putative two-component system response regulator